MPDERQQPTLRRGREGGRWVNERPTPADFAEWFISTMKVDPKLNAEDYMSGVVLIPAVDSKAKVVTGFANDGRPLIQEREELSYIPYAKVETRINYFWDLVAAHRDEWVATVEPVESPRQSIEDPRMEALRAIGLSDEWTPELVEKVGQLIGALRPGGIAQMTHQLPTGFSITSVPVGQGYSHFLCCTIRVAIYDREEWKSTHHAQRSELAPLRSGRGTKQVPLLIGRNNPFADPSSLMKAETGALGRALGAAGIFTIPGSGIATAEDMADLAQGSAPPSEAPAESNGPPAPTEPPVRTGAEQKAASDDELRLKAALVYRQLGAAGAEQFQSWMKERGHQMNVSALSGPALKGVVKKLEKLADEEGGDAEPSGPAE